jgi:hypothetical protein
MPGSRISLVTRGANPLATCPFPSFKSCDLREVAHGVSQSRRGRGPGLRWFIAPSTRRAQGALGEPADRLRPCQRVGQLGSPLIDPRQQPLVALHAISLPSPSTVRGRPPSLFAFVMVGNPSKVIDNRG